MPGEQSQPGNSQQQTPAQVEQALLKRVESHLEPETENEAGEEAPQQEAETTDTAATETEADSQEQTETEGEAQDALPSVAEVEYEGKKYKVPAELKDAVLRQADYTKKTQEAAEVRKTADALMEHAKTVAAIQQAQFKQLGQLASVDERIAQYEKVDWNQLTAQDAAEAQKHFIAFQQLKDQRTKLIGELGQAQQTQRAAALKAHAARLEEGQKALARDIKGWNADLGGKLASFAQTTYGKTAEEAGSISDPRDVRILHDAYQWRQLQASKPALEKKTPPPQKTLKPAKGSDARNPNQQAYDADRRALRSAKTNAERSHAAQKLILRKLG